MKPERSIVLKKQPNILLIMTDQQFADVMSCAGTPDLNTPAMDSIAAMGTRFEKAYCVQPLCVPSRVGMFTGRYPHEANAAINRKVKKDSVPGPMMGKIFSDAGYDTYYVGKWHLGIPKEQEYIHGFQHMKYIRDNRVDFDIPKGCKDFFKQIQKRDNPFLMVASLVNPHDICEWARQQEMKNGDLPYPPPPEQCPELPANFTIPEDEPTILRKLQQRNLGSYPTTRWRDEIWRTYRWAYHRMVEMVDGYIGTILDDLKASGLDENTIIIFTSDHGDGYAGHKWNQKQVLYEEAVRVPFMIGWKGNSNSGKVDNNNLVNVGLDLIPTMCDFADIKPPENCRGLSMKAATDGKKPLKRDHIVIETEFCNFDESWDIKGRCVRMDRFKYIVYDKGERREQLFDMENDPGEMNNLIADPRNSNEVKRNRQLLQKWIEDTNDSFVM